jgi:hypothetical protein
MTQAISITAAILLIISQVWLVILAYKRGGGLWAVVMFFFSLIGGLVFCLKKKEGWVPFSLNLIAWLGAVGIYLKWF